MTSTVSDSAKTKALMAFDAEDFVKRRINDANISSKSLIVTVFGDVISQHGNWIWLGSLIEALLPIGYSERLVRTSVFRLVKDDWLQVKKVGRRSFYGFTASAQKHYTKAARRIYSGSTQFSDGEWLIVLPSFVPDEQLLSFKRQLEWMGFSKLASGVYAHPSIEKTSLEETINEMNLGDSVIVFSSKTLDDSSSNVLKKLVFEKWNIKELQYAYQKFINNYAEIANVAGIARQLKGRTFEQTAKSSQLEADNYPESSLDSTRRPNYETDNNGADNNGINHTRMSDQKQFFLRILIIHEYRRILLRDHELPKAMLPDDWRGTTAAQLVRGLYQSLAIGSARFVQSELLNADGPLPKPAVEFGQRFR